MGPKTTNDALDAAVAGIENRRRTLIAEYDSFTIEMVKRTRTRNGNAHRQYRILAASILGYGVQDVTRDVIACTSILRAHYVTRDGARLIVKTPISDSQVAETIRGALDAREVAVLN